MYDITAQEVPNLKISTRLVATELLRRGYSIKGFFSVPALLEVTMPESDKSMRIYSVIGESMSFVAGRSVAGNKQVTNALLKRQGMQVPEEIYVSFSRFKQEKERISNFIKKYESVVIKPIDGAHGRNVYMNVKAVGHVARRIADISGRSKADGFVIQQQLDGHDVRILCIDGRYSGSVSRKPASVVGNGESSIRELINIENRRQDRGENYHTSLTKIDITRAQDYLGESGMRRVPAHGESVQVIDIANIGAGGERINMDEKIPSFLRTQAELIATHLRMPICAIDFFVKKIPQVSDTLEQLSPYVIEVNHCPGISMYEDLDDPRQKIITRTLVDFLIREHKKIY